MPSYEGFLEAKEGKVKLGGCCISLTSPQYYCKECTREWSRDEDINMEYQKIIGLAADIGSFSTGMYKIELNFSTRELSWRHFGEEKVKIIQMRKMDNFKENLKNLELLNWKRKYVEPDILDGTQWSVEIIRKGRNINKYGSNKFPENWEEFCKEMSKISGEKFG